MIVWITLAIFLAYLGCELHRRWKRRNMHNINHFKKTEAYRRDILR